jgi:ribosomal protein S18 acetylase RimI-like enzyme
MRIESLDRLTPDAESLLRARALERASEVETSLQQLRRAFEAGKLAGACLYEDQQARALAIWRWNDSHQTYAQVLVLYIPPAASDEWGEQVVDHVFATLIQTPTLAVIEARLRDQSPGVRDAYTRRGMAFFERCRMVRPLRLTPIPVLPVPDKFRLIPWDDSHQAQIEAIASTAYQGSIDAVVVPDTQPQRIVKSLRRLRSAQWPGVDAWNTDASQVILNKQDQVVAYIAAATSGESALIGDLAVHPDYRRRRLARLLMVRAMVACFRQGLASVSLAVTTRSPMRPLCNQLGFQPTDCGEIALWWKDGRQSAWRE